MNCTRARTEIALWAGGDLDERAGALLERHVAVCPACRDFRRDMHGSLRTLYEANAPAPDGLHDSVWPRVASRLTAQTQAEARRADRLNRWLPAAAVAAACLALLALMSEPEPRRQDVDGMALPTDGMMVLQPAQRADQRVFVGPRRPVDPLQFFARPPGERHHRRLRLDNPGVKTSLDPLSLQLLFGPRSAISNDGMAGE